MNTQVYTDLVAFSVVVGTADRSSSYICLDLKTLFEGLCSQGEEVQVRQAIVSVESKKESTEDWFLSHLAMIVADAALANATDQDTNDLDELLHAMTGGDFEFKVLTEPQLSTKKFGITYPCCRQTVDLTKDFKKASKLIFSPLLATNPEIALCFISRGDIGTDNIEVNLMISLKYVIVTKQARMLK